MKQKILIVTFLLVGVCATLPAQVDNKIPRLRISTSGGMGYLTAKGKENMDGFINKEKINQLEDDLRWATHLNGDIHYLFRSGLGIGAKYIFHKTSGKAEGVITNYMEVSDYLEQLHYTVTYMSEKDYINYLGLSLGAISAIGNSEKLFLTTSYSAGYMRWRSEGSLFYQNLLTTGGNVAMNAEIGLDYLFHPNLGIGANLGAFLGYINKIKITDGITTQEQKLDKESRYNASNIHLTLGLRYYLNR